MTPHGFGQTQGATGTAFRHGQATATGPIQKGKTTWESVSFSADGYLLGSYRIATAPEANSSRLKSFKPIRFDSPANNVGPWPASLGCTTNSYSSFNPSSANPSGTFTPPTHTAL